MKKLIWLLVFVLCLSACGYTADLSDLDARTPVTRELPETPDGIWMELVDAEENGCKIRYTNRTAQEWIYGEYFRVEVLLEDTWYHVPVRTDKDVDYTFTAMGYVVAPEESREQFCSFDMYGTLPAGQYRIVTDYGWAEFMIP